MVYILPRPHKCTKCGHEQDMTATGFEQYCPKCMSEFLRCNVGVMERTDDFGGGSDFERTQVTPEAFYIDPKNATKYRVERNKDEEVSLNIPQPKVVGRLLADEEGTIQCVVIGNFSHCEHNNSVVIGNNQKSDKPNQLKIGNDDISVSRDITDEEFQEILATFKRVRDFLPSKQCKPTGFGCDTLYNLK